MFIVHGKEEISDVFLLLSAVEATELRDAIDSLLLSDNNHHEHICSSDYQKEITVSIIENNPLETYHSDIRAIIERTE